jgi:hypothetical protein
MGDAEMENRAPQPAEAIAGWLEETGELRENSDFDDSRHV